MAWRLSPVTEPSWARTTWTQEALGTDQIRIVASGEAENTKSYSRTTREGSCGENSALPELPMGDSTKERCREPNLRHPGSEGRAGRTWDGWNTTLVTFLVWPLSVARICSELLSNTMTFLSAPPGKANGKRWDGSVGPTHKSPSNSW